MLTGDQKKNLAELKKQYTERTGQFNPNKWMDDIGMSKEQKEKWTTLTKNRGKAYNELYARQKDITREERTAVYQKLNKEYQAKFDAILTDEQKEKRAKRFRRPAGGQGGVGVVRNWYKELGLTDEQQKKMRILGAERGKKVRDIYANKELARKEKAAAAGKAYKEYTGKLNAIYTPEQRKKLKERRGSGGIRILPKRKQKDK